MNCKIIDYECFKNLLYIKGFTLRMPYYYHTFVWIVGNWRLKCSVHTTLYTLLSAILVGYCCGALPNNKASEVGALPIHSPCNHTHKIRDILALMEWC